VVGSMTQNVERPTQTYLGKGKLEEVHSLRHTFDTLILDDELNPTQQHNVENALGEGVKVIDRTALILDIFAGRARTREGRLQVELAQHQYLLPRLAGQWSHLERLGGGIGTRGPGETQIETDRRLINHRIQRLRKELEEVRKHRSRYRNRRRSQEVPVVALVGYTNAGKSTLFNALTTANVIESSLLFATLDPVTRRVHLPSGQNAIFTDTVGFIHKLPPAVVAAFHATLEELKEANVILHVMDISHKNVLEQASVVEGILKQLELEDKPMVQVLNKVDLLSREPEGIDTHRNTHQTPADFPIDGVPISALNSTGLHDLLERIDQMLAQAPEVSTTYVSARH
jgi:GTP-binding protein HflX